MMENVSPGSPDQPGHPLASQLDQFRRALFARTPRAWVTPALIAVNVAVFVAMVGSGVNALNPTSASLVKWGADYGPKTTAGQPWRLLTNTFIHIGVPHIAMNMIALWMIGRTVERLLGNLGFLVTYLLAGLCGSLASTLWQPFTVSAGASGAIFGIYGALIGYLVRNRGQIPREVLSSLQKTAVALVGLNVVIGLQLKGIDMAAHLGGLGGGLVAGLFVGRPVSEDRRVARHRALLVGAVGIAMVALAARSLPRTVDLAGELAAVQAVEKDAAAAYEAGVERISREELRDEDLAHIIDQQVLPLWRELQRHLAPAETLSRKQQPLARELAAYVQARERAWSGVSAALHQHDRAALHDALEGLRTLNGKEEPTPEADSPSTAAPTGPVADPDDGPDPPPRPTRRPPRAAPSRP